jgi:putative hydrolase of the HAD superfamily
VIEAVISDFGGVVTLPLDEAFARAHAARGLPLDVLRDAMRLLSERDGEPPLFRLERGDLSEPQFIAALEDAMGAVTGRSVSLDGYGDALMGSLQPNEPLLAYYGALRARGLRLAICTNNVREWQPRWLPLLPAGLFELVVDSGFEGTRKPERAIYEIVLARLGLPASACAFVDDVEVNVRAARELGMHGVHFRDTAQAIAELDALFPVG